MSRLADMLDVSLSNATGLIDRIEERGFVERIRVPSDRRIVLVRITAAGRADARRGRVRSRGDPRSGPRRTRRAQLDRRRGGHGRPSRRAVDATARRSTLGRPPQHTSRKGGTEALMEAFPADAGEEYVPIARGGSGPRPEPPREDGDPLRGHARPVPRRARPDDRRSGAADHRHPAERQRLLRLGHHHLPADQHDQRPVLGQAVGHLRPQADLHDRHRDLPGRLGPVRPEPEHGDAHPLPRHPGHRRRCHCSRSRSRSSATCSPRRSAASTRASSAPSSASRSSPARSSAGC